MRLSDDDDRAAIWTIISAVPFDNGPRDRIIDAQIEVMRDAQCAVGFRLINLEELGHAFRNDYVSGLGTVLWSR